MALLNKQERKTDDIVLLKVRVGFKSGTRVCSNKQSLHKVCRALIRYCQVVRAECAWQDTLCPRRSHKSFLGLRGGEFIGHGHTGRCVAAGTLT